MQQVKFEWKTIKDNRDAYVHRLNDIYHNNLKGSSVDEFSGYAKFVGPKRYVIVPHNFLTHSSVEVNGEVYTADHISLVICCGGVVFVWFLALVLLT